MSTPPAVPQERRQGPNAGVGSGPLGFDALATVLGRIRHGVLVLNPQQQIVFSNAAAKSALQGRRSVCIQKGRLVTEEPGLQLLRATSRRSRASAPEAILVIDKSLPPDRQQLLITRMRLTRQDDPVVLLLHEPQKISVSLPSHLREAYGLTATEFLLVVRLLRGEKLLDAATQMGITRFTARTHIKSIFRKCQVHSQTDLVRLLLNSAAGLLRY